MALSSSLYLGRSNVLLTSSPYLAFKYSSLAHLTNGVLKYQRDGMSPHRSFGTNAGRRYPSNDFS